MLTISEFKTEYRLNPIGLDVEKPRFSWILESEKKDVQQTEFALTVTKEADNQQVWETGNTQSKQSVLVAYGGEPLQPCTAYRVAVEVYDNTGEKACAEGTFETGLLTPENKKAKWITHGYADKVEACPVYCKAFMRMGEVLSARLYASALGIYEVALNGKKVGEDFFAPGWTSYHTRVQVQAYDVTELLEHSNQIEITVANGWFSGVLGFVARADHYGSRTAAWAQLEITYTNGQKQTICSDESWQYGTSHCRYAEFYHGETIDYQYPLKLDGAAVIFDYPQSVLTAQENEPVRITQRVKPKTFFVTPKGEAVIDFGQNLTGVVEARLALGKGERVVLRHAEVLDKDGNFYTENLRSARATDTYIGSGKEETFMPRFTFHGFRYVMVEGLGEAIDLDVFTACVMHSDMEPIGDFHCSHEGINRLQQNIVWGQRGNFLDIPTDCPQRDERLGWTGDAQVFAATAAFQFHTALFFAKWLKDLKAEQTAERGVPFVIPNILGPVEGAAAWSDAATIIPWAMYMAYGDRRLLEEQYESMKGWVEYIRSKAGDRNLWQSGFQFADWLALDKEEGPGLIGATDVYLVASAYYAYSTEIVAKAAAVLEKKDDAAFYSALHEKIVAAFQNEYMTNTGRIVSETQTGCVLALHFGLARKEHRERVLQSLTQNIAKHNNHLTTGFVGTPYLCHTLSENGCHALAGVLLQQRDYPSWLYCVDLGATTVWERWNSMKPDGTFDEAGMNSFNHYAYGSIGSWLYEKLGGITMLAPGYEKIQIAPKPVVGITHVRTALKTPYGLLSCAWDCRNGRFTVDITVPVNTTAVVHLPDSDQIITVGSGSYHYEYAAKHSPSDGRDAYGNEGNFSKSDSNCE